MNPPVVLPGVRKTAGIAYRESGDAERPALVLLHGIGSTSAVWREQYAPLGERFRVVAWTAPGYHESAALLAQTPKAQEYGAALAKLLDALGIREADLVTNSWGTLVALGFATLHPGRVRKLVLGGPTAGCHGLAPEQRDTLLAERIARVRSLGLVAMRQQDAPRLVAQSATPQARDVLIDMPAGPYNDARRALIHGDLKLIVSNEARFELYDLANDPGEKNNIWKTSAGQAIGPLYAAAKSRLREIRVTGKRK